MLTISSVVHKEWLEDKVSLDYYEFFADEDSDLPTGGEYTPDEPTDITYKIAQGSMGYVISTSTMYLLSSEGSWVEQESSGGGGGGGGTTNYEQLSHKPQINGTTLSGNKSLSDLGIAAAADIPSVPVQSVSKNGTAITPSAQGNVNITVPTQASDVNALSSDTKYAGSATQGGSAISAAKLDTASAGSATQPVYFTNGVPTATTYSLEKSVPSNAAFTDTTYEVKSESEGGSAESLVTTGDIYSWNRMIPASQKGANSGVATLDSNGKLVSSQLPLGSTATTAAAGNHTHTLSLASDSGTSQISLLPNTKYKLTGGGSTYVFTTPSDSDTTYTLAAGTGDDANKVVLTPSSGSAQKITVPYATSAGSASSASAVAWSGVSSKPSTISGYGITDAKIANGVVTLGANTITPLTSHQSVTDNNPTLAWNTKSKVATIGNTDINVTMPAQPSYTASDVGLGNVTNNAQVKKISSAVSGDIVTWSGTDGATVADSGVKVQTSSTAMDGTSDAQVPTSRNIKTNVTKTAVLTDYTKSTTAKQALATTDTVNSAFGKIEKRVSDNENNISLVYDECGAEKNALRFDGFNLTAGNVNGVSYRLNADKSITVNGKPSGTSPSYTYLYWKNNPLYIDNLCNGEYVLSGCPDGGSDSTFKMYVAKGTYTKTDYGNGVELTSTSETGILFVIYIHNSYTANNLTFKPMICKKELWEVAHKYEPNNTNKVCECFGDSLTWYDGNAFTWGARQGDICVGFESYLRDYLDLTVHNNGVMGETTPEICTRIKNASSSTIIAADCITIMGGDNDDRLSVNVGTIAPSGSNFDTTTVIGALQSAIETTLTTNARTKIILMTEPIGWTYKNGAMTRVDEKYANAYRTVAEYYGLPLIDNWKYSGINELTRAAYTADPQTGNTNYIYHPSNEGWRRISMYMLSELKKYVQ